VLHRYQNVHTTRLGRDASFQIQTGTTEESWRPEQQLAQPQIFRRSHQGTLRLISSSAYCNTSAWAGIPGHSLTDKCQRAACAFGGYYICVLLMLTPEVPVSHPVLIALHLSCKLISSTHRGKKVNLVWIKTIKHENLLGAIIKLSVKTTLPLHKYTWTRRTMSRISDESYGAKVNFQQPSNGHLQRHPNCQSPHKRRKPNVTASSSYSSK